MTVVTVNPTGPPVEAEQAPAERRWVIRHVGNGKARVEVVEPEAPRAVFTPAPSAAPSVRVVIPTPAPAKLTSSDERPRDACGRRRSPATMPGYGLGREPGNKGKRYGKDYLRPPEIERLLDRCFQTTADGRRSYALIVLIWRSGLRISEALALEPHDLDQELRLVHVRNGKGSKERRAQMDAWGFEVLAEWLEIRAKYPPGPIFCVLAGPNKGVRAWGASAVRRKLHELARLAGITKRVHPHLFRATLACELMLDRKPLSYIQHALGHASPAVTAVYLEGLGMTESLADVSSRSAPGFVKRGESEEVAPGVERAPIQAGAWSQEEADQHEMVEALRARLAEMEAELAAAKGEKVAHV